MLCSWGVWHSKFTLKWQCDSNWEKLWRNSYLQLWYRLHSDGRHHSDMSSYRVVVWECTHLSKYVAAFKLEIGPCYYLCPDSFQQLWTVALWATQSMAKSVTPLGTHMDSQSPTTVMKAISCWETTLAYVKLLECGQGVYQLVNVHFYNLELQELI